MMTTQTDQTEASKKKRAINLSLGVQLLIAFTLLFGIVFGGIYYWFYNFSSDTAMNRVQDDLDTLLVGIAAQIDGDEFEALVKSGTPSEEGYYPTREENPAYWDHVEFLGQMNEIDPRALLYTFTKGTNENDVVFVGSMGAVAEEQWGVTFLQIITYPPEDAEVILKGVEETNFEMTPYEDAYGSWVSGYTPITNSAGESVGALGIDFRADYVKQVQKDVRDGMLPAIGITSVLLISMVFFVSTILTRPIVALTRIAGHIGEGDYDQDLTKLTDSPISDEINKLAEVFEIMVSKVARREQKLKQQVAELQILIDDTKRQEQVNEIVDSDFFRDLKSKANKIRQDFAKTGRDPSATAAAAEEKAAADTPPPDAG